MLTIKTARVDQGTKNQSSTKAIPYIGAVLLRGKDGGEGKPLENESEPQIETDLISRDMGS